METDPYEDDRFDEAFCREIVEKVPAIAPLLDEHLRDQDGELLSYIFMSTVAEWAEKNIEVRSTDVIKILGILNQGLSEGKRDVPNLIVVGFMEWLLAETPLDPLLQGGLKDWGDFHTGITENHPILRSGH